MAFFKFLSFNESFSKIGKLRTLFENHPTALKHEENKRDLKTSLDFFCFVFGSSQKMKSGLGEAPI